MTNDVLSHVALQLIPGVGNANIKNLISYAGPPESILRARKKELSRIPGIGQKTINAILQGNTRDKAEKIIAECELQNISVIPYTAKEYPARLKQIYDSPGILYYKGNATLNPGRSISVVGTRRATNYGKRVVDEMMSDMKGFAPTVISGLAYGIDIESHKKSLSYGLPTIAVLAGGLDQIYPRNHEHIAHQMLEYGGLLSEYPPGTKPEAHLFPARNRIIAGLGDATIVVEAGHRGGALITANIADSYSRPVFAVPGDLDRTYSAGCNNLLKYQKAVIYTGVKDLVYYLNWDQISGNPQPPADPLKDLSSEERNLVELLQNQGEGVAIDELAWKGQYKINELASLLLSLEFKGLVKTLPGKKYELSVCVS